MASYITLSLWAHFTCEKQKPVVFTPSCFNSTAEGKRSDNGLPAHNSRSSPARVSHVDWLNPTAEILVF